jgi:hypothetical protein
MTCCEEIQFMINLKKSLKNGVWLCGTLIHVILTWDFIISMLKNLNKNFLNVACHDPKCKTAIHGLLIGKFNQNDPIWIGIKMTILSIWICVM